MGLPDLHEQTKLDVELIEPNRTKDRLVLWGSLVCMYAYIVFTNLKKGFVFDSALANGAGQMIGEGLIMLIIYFIAKGITKTTGRWHKVYLGMLLAYLMLSPMLQRYGRGGSFF